jgi:hypothetical protein
MSVIKIKPLTFSLKLMYNHTTWGGKCNATLISLCQLQMLQSSVTKLQPSLLTSLSSAATVEYPSKLYDCLGD